MDFMATKNSISIISKLTTVFLLIAFAGLAIAGYQRGIFDSVDAFQNFINSTGLLGPLIFIFIQIIQIVIPMLPGFVTCIAGAVVFGPAAGFFYSYIGVCIGSIMAFYIARKYGIIIVQKIISEEKYNKYMSWLEKGRKFDILFALAILLPTAPDDVLCFIAGLTKMTWKKFIVIILLGKPFVIALYSIGTAGFSQILDFL